MNIQKAFFVSAAMGAMGDAQMARWYAIDTRMTPRQYGELKASMPRRKFKGWQREQRRNRK